MHKSFRLLKKNGFFLAKMVLGQWLSLPQVCYDAQSFLIIIQLSYKANQGSLRDHPVVVVVDRARMVSGQIGG